MSRTLSFLFSYFIFIPFFLCLVWGGRGDIYRRFVSCYTNSGTKDIVLSSVRSLKRKIFLLLFFAFHGSVHVHAMTWQQQLYSLVLLTVYFLLSLRFNWLSSTITTWARIAWLTTYVQISLKMLTRLHRKYRIKYLTYNLLFDGKDLLWTRTNFGMHVIGSQTIVLGVVCESEHSNEILQWETDQFYCGFFSTNCEIFKVQFPATVISAFSIVS